MGVEARFERHSPYLFFDFNREGEFLRVVAAMFGSLSLEIYQMNDLVGHVQIGQLYFGEGYALRLLTMSEPEYGVAVPGTTIRTRGLSDLLITGV